MVGEWLAAQEEVKVNDWLDELKCEYDYEEYSCMGVFSNGKTIYRKI